MFFYNTDEHIFNSQRVKKNTERIGRNIKLEVLKFISHIFGKAGTDREYFRSVTYRVAAFWYGYLSTEVHFLFLAEAQRFFTIKLLTIRYILFSVILFFSLIAK